MKKSLVFLIGLVLAAPAFAQFRDTRLNDLLDKQEVTWTEAAAAAVLSEALGLDTASLFQRVNPYGSMYDWGLGAWIGLKTGRPVDEVHKLRQQGLGWGQIAQRLGMHPGTFNKMRRAGAFDGGFWPWIVNERYGLPSTSWKAARDRGLSAEEVLVAAVLSRGDSKKFSGEVASPRGRGKGKGASGGQGQGNSKGKGKGRDRG